MDKPVGLEEHSSEETRIKIPHWIIIEHQKLYPALAEQMKDSKKATALYTYFLVSAPFKQTKQWTEEMRNKLLTEFRLMKKIKEAKQ